ncbi:MAG: hypothetical protein ABIJ46_01625 [bacterium]
MLMLAAAAAAETGPGQGLVKAVDGLVGYVSAVNWATPTWDLFIVIFFVVTVFLYGMSLGRDRIIVILVSIYMALAVVSNVPVVSSSSGSANVLVGNLFVLKVTTFLGLFILLFFLLSRSALMRTFGNLANGSWFQIFLFSIFHVGLLVSITLSFLPPDAANNLAPLTRTVFASDWAKFIWVVAPVASMMVLKA